MPNDPESELARFLASLATYKRKEFQHGASSFTPDEVYEWCKVEMATHRRLQDEYLRLLRRIPAKWREYRVREANANADLLYPANPSGRPRKDDLAIEAEALRKNGLSWKRIAINLNARHGEGTTSGDGIRKLVKSRESKASNTQRSPENT